MARPVLSLPHLQNEEAAFAYVEQLLWPNGPMCPFASKKTGVVCASLPQAQRAPSMWRTFAPRQSALCWPPTLSMTPRL